MACALSAAERIEMPFGELTLVSQRNRVLDGGRDWMNLTAATRGNKVAM